MRRLGNYRYIRFLFLDLPGGFISVDYRDLDIHQDQVNILLKRQIHGFLAGGSPESFRPGTVDNNLEETIVYLIILNHQYGLS